VKASKTLMMFLLTGVKGMTVSVGSEGVPVILNCARFSERLLKAGWSSRSANRSGLLPTGRA